MRTRRSRKVVKDKRNQIAQKQGRSSWNDNKIGALHPQIPHFGNENGTDASDGTHYPKFDTEKIPDTLQRQLNSYSDTLKTEAVAVSHENEVYELMRWTKTLRNLEEIQFFTTGTLSHWNKNLYVGVYTFGVNKAVNWRNHLGILHLKS